MRNEALLNNVAEAAKAYYLEAYKNINRFNIVTKEPPRKYKKALKSAENEAFYGGFDEDEIYLAKQRGETQAIKEMGIDKRG